VLRGRMSLIGPRPEDPAFVALHADAYERILAVRPGITGIS
jgi:lipopolysaccharide/colanic/teichoic acid biosynthesis glycosyltransferase